MGSASAGGYRGGSAVICRLNGACVVGGTPEEIAALPA